MRCTTEYGRLIVVIVVVSELDLIQCDNLIYTKQSIWEYNRFRNGKYAIDISIDWSPKFEDSIIFQKVQSWKNTFENVPNVYQLLLNRWSFGRKHCVIFVVVDVMEGRNRNVERILTHKYFCGDKIHTDMNKLFDAQKIINFGFAALKIWSS